MAADVTGLIGIDWGTSNMRAFRYGADGSVTDLRRSSRGMSTVLDRDFAGVLKAEIGDWLADAPRIIVSGMAGAREGWIEAPYAPCPADLAKLAGALTPIPTDIADAYIVPGLVAENAGEARGIMRGEETQIFGVIDAYETPLVIAPGTHSKWARIESDAVSGIATFMTGEVFGLMKSQSIIARLIAGDAHDEAAFMLGVERAAADASLLRLLFTARTEGLFGGVQPHAMASYLSGLLIGSEVGAGLSPGDKGSPLLVIAAEALGALYVSALAAHGASKVTVIDGEAAAARGLWRIATARGLI